LSHISVKGHIFKKKMKLVITKTQKIFILFILGIGFPCILLSFFAYRGIKNDQALIEKEKRKEFLDVANFVTTIVADTINEANQALLKTIESSQPSSQVFSQIAAFKAQHAPIEEIFLVLDSKIKWLTHRPLYQKDPLIFSFHSGTLSKNTTLLIEKARHCEFQSQKHSEAIVLYRQAFKQAADLPQKVQLLNSIARVQKKLNRKNNAIQSYEEMSREFSNIPLYSGIPAGLAARYEIATLHKINNDSLKALGEFFDLYTKLLESTWSLKKTHYEFYRQKIAYQVHDILSSNRSQTFANYQLLHDSLVTLEDELQKKTNRLLTFQNNAISTLLTDKSEKHLTNPIKNYSLEMNGELYLISLINVSMASSNDIRTFGILFNPDYFKSHLLPAIINQHSLSKTIKWRIADRSGNIVFTSDKSISGIPTIKANFIYNMPPWTLQLFHSDMNFFNTLFLSRRSIYFYIFFLIASILTFGLYLTSRTLSHEMELVKMKSNFVSAVSHELKSPVTSIRQLAEMLRAGRIPSEERRQRYHEVLVEQSERLSFLVENVLDSARMEEKQIAYAVEKVQIKELLMEIVSKFQQMNECKGIFNRDATGGKFAGSAG